MNIFEPSHCTLSEAVEVLGDRILQNPVLAVIRNPFDRLVSMFFFAKKYDLGSIYGIDTEHFDRFAEQFYDHSHDPDFFHAISQQEFIMCDGANPYICRFENLVADIESFLKESGMDDVFNIADFPRLNGTEHKHYREYYSCDSISIVEKMWRDDLDLFSYVF